MFKSCLNSLLMRRMNSDVILDKKSTTNGSNKIFSISGLSFGSMLRHSSTIKSNLSVAFLDCTGNSLKL